MALQPYVRIAGRREVMRALNRLAIRTSQIGLRRAMLDLGVVMKREYLAVVPVHLGYSKKSIRHWTRYVGGRKDNVMLYIGPHHREIGGRDRQGKRPFDYLHFPDHGTKRIRAQRFAGAAFRRGRSSGAAAVYARLRRAIYWHGS